MSETTSSNEKFNQTQQDFRNHIGTVDADGNRIWLYPHKPSGKYYTLRRIVSVFLLLILFGLPFIKIDGHSAVLLDIIHRKFVFFGYIFWPQDLYIFAVIFLTLVVFILFTTATVGRLWCGWLCPQIVFMEMVFRPIEWLFEGHGRKQRKFDEQPSDAEKTLRKFFKHVVFFGISFLIGNTFLAYIIGVDALWAIVTDNPLNHLGGLSAMIAFTFVFYGVFAYFREQACLIVCPYGRLQSVLQDQDTVMVTYDHKRGETRGKKKRGVDQSHLGDCVDCNQCVVVCPTGIDIRNGIQMECVNCTACMDSCDAVMDKLNRPKGLIRYASMNMVSNESKFKWSPRMLGYAGVLIILICLDIFLLSQLSNVNVLLARVRGSKCVQLDDGRLANFYSLQLLNKTYDDKTFSLKLLDEKGGEVQMAKNPVVVKGESMFDGKLLIVLDRKDLKYITVQVKIGIYEGDILQETVTTNFMGPGGKSR